MASRIFRGARGGAVALLGLCGLISSCNSGPGSGAAAAATPSSHVDVFDNFNVSDLEQHFEEVSRKVAPAVVAISATDAHLEADEALRSDHINPQKLQSILELVDRTVGTGFIVDSEGYIVTNDHVVAACDHLWVTTDDHRVFPAIIVGSDPRADIAVLKIPASHLPTIRFSDAQAHRGQWSIALGNPYGLATGGEMAVSVGVVSAIGRSLPKLSSKEDRLYNNLIQTTAQINPGNSGGPLFDLHGDVIGINTAVILPQKMTNGIGFAIPITGHVRKAIEDLKNGREVAYGWLGVRVSSPTPADRRDMGVAEDLGARIDSIELNSPAGTAKLAAGDLVTKFNGQVIHDGDQLVRLVGEAPTDQNVGAIVYRNKKPSLISLRIGRRPSPLALVTRETQRFRWRGMVLGPIPKFWNFGAGPAPKEGLMVLAIDARSPAAKDGIIQGSVIKSIAGKPVSDIVQLQTVLNVTPPDAAIEAINPGQVASARE
jgi:serine protease Do